MQGETKAYRTIFVADWTTETQLFVEVKGVPCDNPLGCYVVFAEEGDPSPVPG